MGFLLLYMSFQLSRCAGLVDAPECSTDVTKEDCGTMIGFGAIKTNVTSVCPAMCLCNGIAGDADDAGGDGDPEASASSTIVIAAAVASVGAVIIMGIIMYCIMRGKDDSVSNLSNFTSNDNQLPKSMPRPSGTTVAGNSDARVVDNPMYEDPSAAEPVDGNDGYLDVGEE